ncbi:MAG: hypothetical protein ACK5V3_17795 [Bdellovibrionales bacterium]
MGPKLISSLIFKFSFLTFLVCLLLAPTVAEARISKGLKRPQRLVSYALGGGTANLTLNAIVCPGFCLGTPYQLSNTGSGPTSLISFNLPFAPSNPGFDGEIYMSTDCPSTLSAGNSCQIDVILEDGGIYLGCSTLVLTATASPVSASANYEYGDCGASPPEI